MLQTIEKLNNWNREMVMINSSDSVDVKSYTLGYLLASADPAFDELISSMLDIFNTVGIIYMNADIMYNCFRHLCSR